MILSLVLSLLLFVYVKAEQYNENPISFFQNVSEVTTETIYNVPVYIDGNVDEYYVSGLPDSVSVRLSGPKNLIEQTLEADDFRVLTENLSELGEGSHYIQLDIENIPNGVEYEISPSSVNISIDSLQTTDYPVQVEVSNPDAVASGYSITDITVNPGTVSLTGSTSNIDKVNNVYTVVNIPDDLSEDYTTNATVITQDADGNILDINTNPEEAEVTVHVSQDGTEVPIQVNLTNEQSDYTYETQIVNGSGNARLTGDADTIAGIESVTATVDVSDITESTTVDAPITVPTGAEAVEPTSVSVQVVPTLNQSSASSSASSAESSEESSDISSESSSAESTDSSAIDTSDANESESSEVSDTEESQSSESTETSEGNINSNSTGLENSGDSDEINAVPASDIASSSPNINLVQGVLAFFTSFF